MNVGPGIFLVSLGAVMAFAVNYPTDHVDVAVVGWILMATGAVLIRLEFLEFSARRRSSLTALGDVEPAPAAPAAPATAPAAAPAPAPAAAAPAAPAAPNPPVPVPAPRQSTTWTPGPAGPGPAAANGGARVQWPEGLRRG